MSQKEKPPASTESEENESEIEESVIRVIVSEQDTRAFKRLDHFLSKKIPPIQQNFFKKSFLNEQYYS